MAEEGGISVARTLFERIRANLAKQARRRGTRYPLRRGVNLVRVRVWETPRGWAEYEAPRGKEITN